MLCIPRRLSVVILRILVYSHLIDGEFLIHDHGLLFRSAAPPATPSPSAPPTGYKGMFFNLYPKHPSVSLGEGFYQTAKQGCERVTCRGCIKG